MGIREKEFRTSTQAWKHELKAIEVLNWPVGRTGKRESLLIKELYPLENHRALPKKKESPIPGVCSKESTETRFEDSDVLYESNRMSCVKHMRWLAGQFNHSSWQGGKDIWSELTIAVWFLLFFTGNPYGINQTDNGKRLSVFYSTILSWASTGSGTPASWPLFYTLSLSEQADKAGKEWKKRTKLRLRWIN